MPGLRQLQFPHLRNGDNNGAVWQGYAQARQHPGEKAKECVFWLHPISWTLTPELAPRMTVTLNQLTGCHALDWALSPTGSHSISTTPTFQRKERAPGKLCSSVRGLQGRDATSRMSLHLRRAEGRPCGGRGREAGRLVQDLGSSGWRTGQEATVWRSGSELELQVHKLIDALQRPAR